MLLEQWLEQDGGFGTCRLKFKRNDHIYSGDGPLGKNMYGWQVANWENKLFLQLVEEKNEMQRVGKVMGVEHNIKGRISNFSFNFKCQTWFKKKICFLRTSALKVVL